MDVINTLFKFILLTILGFFIVLFLVGHSFLSGEMFEEFNNFHWLGKAFIVFYAFIMFGGKEGWTPKFQRWFSSRGSVGEHKSSTRVNPVAQQEVGSNPAHSTNLPEDYRQGYDKYCKMLNRRKS